MMARERGWFYFGIMSYNMGDGPAQAKLNDLLKFAQLKLPHNAPMVFINCQEMMDRETVILDFITIMRHRHHVEWGVILKRGRPNEGHECPNLYNKTYARPILVR